MNTDRSTSKPYKLLIMAAQRGCTVEELVWNALDKFGGIDERGSVVRAAAELGVSRVNLSRFLNDHTYPERATFQVATE